jgi:hypothetical protein
MKGHLNTLLQTFAYKFKKWLYYVVSLYFYVLLASKSAISNLKGVLDRYSYFQKWNKDSRLFLHDLPLKLRSIYFTRHNLMEDQMSRFINGESIQPSIQLFISVLIVFICSTNTCIAQHGPVQDDTVSAPEAISPPILDGRDNDDCWQNIPWQPITQVWIPYGAAVDSSDFSGRYKITWSSVSNLLYILVEVMDNVFVDGFKPGITSDLFNYDIIEVFIDENKSGGMHVFSGKDTIGIQLGTNSANAFSYHIYARFPEEGGVTKDHYVQDIAGTDWSDIRRVNYSSHIPEFALYKKGTKAVWEFSLIVYNDKYDEFQSREDMVRPKLRAGKIMGLSLAYCDNDHPEIEPKVRGKFFGSVWVPPAAYNDHWKNADYFGTVKLTAKSLIHPCKNN